MALKSPSKKASHFHVDQADLHCKNKCGYYANKSWQGYCSKCYRDVYQKSSKISSVEQEHVRKSNQPIAPFFKFEEKKKLQEKGVASVKSLFKKPVSKAEAFTLREGPTPAAALTADSNDLGTELAACLNCLDRQLADEVRTKVLGMKQKLYDMPQSAMVDDWSDCVQDFYQELADHLGQGRSAAVLSDESQQTLMDCIEGYLTHAIYTDVFCPLSDEDADLKLHKRIRSLHWVSERQLEANVAAEQDLGVRATLELAMTEIIQMDASRSPKEKLQCIVDCSRAIFTALHKSRLVASSMTAASDAGAATVSVSSADDFLPVFIYIVLKANPPRLQSNINYVTRFAHPSRLNRGEGGYYFTNLCCVVDFVRKLNAESLNLTQEEFDGYMSGERTPEGSGGVGSVGALYMCDGLRLMHENSLLLEELRRRQTRLDEAAAALKQQTAASFSHLSDSTEELLRHTCPLASQRQPRRRRVDPDFDIELPNSLPAPLLPQMTPQQQTLTPLP